MPTVQIMIYLKKAQIGDIWLILLPKVLTNNQKTKIDLEKRPCLIIDNEHDFIIEENRDYLGLKLTTKSEKNHAEISNWYDLGLKKPPYVRIETPIKIEQRQLIHKIGTMSKYDLLEFWYFYYQKCYIYIYF